MSNRVHPPMHTEEATRIEPPGDATSPDSRLDELRDRHHTMLSTSDLGH